MSGQVSDYSFWQAGQKRPTHIRTNTCCFHMPLQSSARCQGGSASFKGHGSIKLFAGRGENYEKWLSHWPCFSFFSSFLCRLPIIIQRRKRFNSESRLVTPLDLKLITQWRVFPIMSAITRELTSGYLCSVLKLAGSAVALLRILMWNQQCLGGKFCRKNTGQKKKHHIIYEQLLAWNSRNGLPHFSLTLYI